FFAFILIQLLRIRRWRKFPSLNAIDIALWNAPSSSKKQKKAPEHRVEAPTNSKGVRRSALQFNPDHLERFVAQIFRQMIESRKVHDLSSLCLNVFRLPVRIREA